MKVHRFYFAYLWKNAEQVKFMEIHPVVGYYLFTLVTHYLRIFVLCNVDYLRVF